jgi:hypothetical protein
VELRLRAVLATTVVSVVHAVQVLASILSIRSAPLIKISRAAKVIHSMVLEKAVVINLRS